MIPPKQFEKILVPTKVLCLFAEEQEDEEEDFLLLGLDLVDDYPVTTVWVNYEEKPEECLTISVALINQWGEEHAITMTFYEEDAELYNTLQYTGEVLDYAEILTHPLKAVRESASRSYRRERNEAH